MLSMLMASIELGIRFFEHHSVAARIFAEADFMAGGEAPELSEVEIDDSSPGSTNPPWSRPASISTTAFTSGHLYAEALRHVDIVLFRKDIGYVVATDGVGEGQSRGVGGTDQVVGPAACTGSCELRREQESGGYHQFFHFTWLWVGREVMD